MFSFTSRGQLDLTAREREDWQMPNHAPYNTEAGPTPEKTKGKGHDARKSAPYSTGALYDRDGLR
jgi:hypothetical protein